MTKLLEKALEKVSTLPQDEQHAIAAQILAELEDEAAWETPFVRQRPKLRRPPKVGSIETRLVRIQAVKGEPDKGTGGYKPRGV
jgi:hypothetical protein